MPKIWPTVFFLFCFVFVFFLYVALITIWKICATPFENWISKFIIIRHYCRFVATARAGCASQQEATVAPTAPHVVSLPDHSKQIDSRQTSTEIDALFPYVSTTLPTATLCWSFHVNWIALAMCLILAFLAKCKFGKLLGAPGMQHIAFCNFNDIDDNNNNNNENNHNSIEVSLWMWKVLDNHGWKCHWFWHANFLNKRQF